uniref:SH3 domain-containing protein n=1 Tax=Babesia bovis TaxID=5865 RepID=S6C829_BABBO|nr:hypothetical protein [Babesia bovis]
MLEVCQNYEPKGTKIHTEAPKGAVTISQFIKGTREGTLDRKSLDAMDDTTQHNIIATGQHRKDIDTASTSPESNSVITEYRNGYMWKTNQYTSDNKDCKATRNMYNRQSWESEKYHGALSDSNPNGRLSSSAEMNTTMLCKRVGDAKYHQITETGSESQRVQSSEGGIYISDISESIFAKTKRSNSFTGAASYGEQTAQQNKPNDTDTTYSLAETENGILLNAFVTDLRNKRKTNRNYPNDLLSFTNNKFTYIKGPLGFPTIFRDSQQNEMIKSESSTMPLTVFSAYTPSHIEENAIAVQPTDKVHLLARHNQWIYVRIAFSKRIESKGKTGWIPEYTLIEPELFSRRLCIQQPHTYL